MKNEFNPLKPKNIKEAINDMTQQINLFNKYKEGIIEPYKNAVEVCKKMYSKSRNIAIKLGGYEGIEIFPVELR